MVFYKCDTFDACYRMDKFDHPTVPQNGTHIGIEQVELNNRTEPLNWWFATDVGHPLHGEHQIGPKTRSQIIS